MVASQLVKYPSSKKTWLYLKPYVPPLVWIVYLKIIWVKLSGSGKTCIVRTQPPSLHKRGWWIFSKMAVMEGGEKFLLEMGKPGMGGGWFYNGWDGKFFKSLYIVGRGVLIRQFYEDPTLISRTSPPFFFQILANPTPPPPPPLPCHLQPPPQRFFLLSCFFGWMGDHVTFDKLLYLMNMSFVNQACVVKIGAIWPF